jgi:hypothetical protein
MRGTRRDIDRDLFVGRRCDAKKTREKGGGHKCGDKARFRQSFHATYLMGLILCEETLFGMQPDGETAAKHAIK